MADDGAPLDEAELVQRCLSGDEAAQRLLIDRYAGLCFSVAARVLGRSSDGYVEDAVQEAMCTAFARLDQWRGGSLAAWIGTIAATRAMDLRKRLRRWSQERTTTGLETAVPHTSATADRSLAELLDALEHARRQLSQRQQGVLSGLVWGKTQAEIAAELGVSERTVASEVVEVRRQLEGILEIVADDSKTDRL